MTFSIRKLEKFLNQKGFIAKNYYVLDNYVIYILIISRENFNKYMLYIPSKYEIKNNDINNNVYKLNIIDMPSETNNIAENYTSLSEKENQIENIYNEINLMTIPENTEDLENNLKDNYDKPIVLKNLTKYKAQNNLKNIINQISRIKNCTKNIKYKLSIFYKNYIYSVSRTDDINSFTIEDFEGVDRRQIFVTLDLEILYSKKIDDIHFDIKNVQDQIYKILKQNHTNNMDILDNMMKKDIFSQNNKINIKLEELSKNIEEFENMIDNLKKTEKAIHEKIKNLHEEYAEKRGFNYDIEKTHKISNYEKELKSVDKLINKVNSNLEEIKSIKEDLILKTDQILFDNSIMIHSIVNNFEKLLEF